MKIILKYLHFHILRKNAGKKDDGKARASIGLKMG